MAQKNVCYRNNYKNAANNDKNSNKGKGKILTTTCQEGTEGEQRYC